MITRLGPRRRATFIRLLRWAQSAAPIREDALADVGLAWPLLRRMLLELGRRLVDSGVLARPDDVFWLRLQELQTAVDFGLAAPAASETPESRKPGAFPNRRRWNRRRTRAHGGRGHYRSRPARPRRRRRGAQDALAGPGEGRSPATASGGQWMERAFGKMMPAGSQTQARRHYQGHRRQLGPRHRSGPRPERASGFRPDGAWRGPGRPHHYPRLDLAVRDGLGRGHRRRRPVKPQLDRGPGVRHPGRARHWSRYPTAYQRPADTRRWGRRHGCDPHPADARRP